MKNIIKMIMLGAIISLCCSDLFGCGTQTQPNKDRNYCDTVYTAFCNKDSKAISSLFCEKTQSSHNLNDEIEGAFEFFDGKIVSYESFSVSTNGEKVREGVVVESHRSPRIEGIKTDNGHIYDILINNREICSDDSSIEGFSAITIFEIDPNDRYNWTAEYKIGEYIEYKE